MINTNAIKNIQATGLKYINGLKILPLNIYSGILALMLLSAGLIGAHIMNDQHDDKVNIPGTNTKASTDPITKAATDTDKDIHNLELSAPSMGVGEFRVKSQDIQQRLTDQWFTAGQATGLSEDEVIRNGLYIRYISAASKVVTSMQEGATPDTAVYKQLYKELTGDDSKVTL